MNAGLRVPVSLLAMKGESLHLSSLSVQLWPGDPVGVSRRGASFCALCAELVDPRKARGLVNPRESLNLGVHG